jgi:hypothetical protein
VTLAALLARLAREGFRLEARGGHIAVRPKDRLTPDLRDEIVRNRADVLELLGLHGDDLLRLFADVPPWPAARGRDGLPVDAEGFIRIIGAPVAFAGRTGTLRAVLYDTRSGRLRLRVDLGDGGGLLLDPEDLEERQPTPAEATR